MNPHTHFLFPLLIALVLSKLNIISWQLALACGFIGALIDIDHYIEHIVHSKTNKFSIKSMWNNSMKYHRFVQRSFIHYPSGAVILTLVFLGLIFVNWQLSLILAIAYYSHLILDYVYFKKDKVHKLNIFGYFIKESNLELGLNLFFVLGLITLFFV